MIFKAVRMVVCGLILLLSSILTGAVNAEDDTVLTISSLDISASVVEFPLRGGTWDMNPWRDVVGHLEETAWFDAPGNIVLAAHSQMPDGTAGLFADLDELTTGAEIVLTSDGSEQRYSVMEVRIVPEEEVSVVFPTEDERLTLITCDVGSFFDEETQSYRNRLVVIATRVS